VLAIYVAETLIAQLRTQNVRGLDIPPVSIVTCSYSSESEFLDSFIQEFC
jgi:hypothetical protein